MPLTPKEMVKLLKKNGFKELKYGLEQEILKQAGLK